MNPLAIRYDSHGTAPIIIECLDDRSKLRFQYGTTSLERYRNALVIELSPTGEATVVQLQLADGQLSARAGEPWINVSDGVCVQTFTTPSSDYLTVDVGATQATGTTNNGKLYIKIKPHGGLPAGEG
jgi:hypothetical protein